MGNLIPFNLEAFKAGQKALTRDGRVATFIGVCKECYEYCQLIVSIDGTRLPMALHLNGMHNATLVGICDTYDLVSMVSRHHHLIDAYNPEDTWQWKPVGVEKWDIVVTAPTWDEETDFRLHPWNNEIKAWKKGAKILGRPTPEYDWEYLPHPKWQEDAQYHIKPEPTIHCLAYDAKRFDHEQTTAVRARVVKKEVAESNGWKIIQEWEV